MLLPSDSQKLCALAEGLPESPSVSFVSKSPQPTPTMAGTLPHDQLVTSERQGPCSWLAQSSFLGLSITTFLMRIEPSFSLREGHFRVTSCQYSGLSRAWRLTIFQQVFTRAGIILKFFDWEIASKCHCHGLLMQ